MGKPSEAWLVLERTAKSQMQKDCLCWHFKGSLFFDQPAISSSLRIIQPLASTAKRARLLVEPVSKGLIVRNSPAVKIQDHLRRMFTG